MRGNDTAARLGGDEFVLVLTPLHDAAECDVILARVKAAVSQPVALGPERLGHVSASIGVALCPGDAVDADRLLTLADEAMYRAKQARRERRQPALV